MLSSTMTACESPSGIHLINVIAVNFPATSLPQLRVELSRNLLHLESEFSKMSEIVTRFSLTEEWTGRENNNPVLLLICVASSEDQEELVRLRTLLPYQPILALCSNGIDPKRLMSSMDERVTRIASLPLQSDNFKAALDSLAQPCRRPAPDHPVLAVCGVTGGSGATTLALNLAYGLASQHHLRCLLVDLSFQMGMLATNLNIEPPFTIRDVL